MRLPLGYVLLLEQALALRKDDAKMLTDVDPDAVEAEMDGMAWDDYMATLWESTPDNSQQCYIVHKTTDTYNMDQYQEWIEGNYELSRCEGLVNAVGGGPDAVAPWEGVLCYMPKRTANELRRDGLEIDVLPRFAKFDKYLQEWEKDTTNWRALRKALGVQDHVPDMMTPGGTGINGETPVCLVIGLCPGAAHNEKEKDAAAGDLAAGPASGGSDTNGYANYESASAHEGVSSGSSEITICGLKAQGLADRNWGLLRKLANDGRVASINLVPYDNEVEPGPCPDCTGTFADNTDYSHYNAMLYMGGEFLNPPPPAALPQEGGTRRLRSNTTEARRLNLNAQGITQSGNPNNGEATGKYLNNAGIEGQGQIVGVGDSGLDLQSCFFTPNPFNGQTQPQIPTGRAGTVVPGQRKVIQYVGFADGIAGERGDHGTHVAGTVAGASVGVNAGRAYDGVAPEAKIAMFDIGRAGQPFLDVPRSLFDGFFGFASEAKASIHTNSWGASVNRYSTNARDVDRYSFANEDFVVLVANGNDGRNGPGSCGTPATAKNCIAVGASTNAQTGNIEDMASFSSQGPTSDGRISPTVAAPGHQVVSANSAASQAPTPTCSITGQSGTSMATPATAGLTALVRQYFIQGRYPGGEANTGQVFTPSGALLKAIIVHSGRPMTGNLRGQGGFPGMSQGFGRVTADEVLPVGGETLQNGGGGQGRRLFVRAANLCNVVDNNGVSRYVPGGGCPGGQRTRVSIGANQVYEQTFEVTAGSEFKATLVWMDAAAATNAARHIVNDLDLSITTPGGDTVHPNRRNSPDRINTVEMARVANAGAGTYTVRVRGQTVRQSSPGYPAGQQAYALVVTGRFPQTADGEQGTPGPAPPMGGDGDGGGVPPPQGRFVQAAAGRTCPQSNFNFITEVNLCIEAGNALGLQPGVITTALDRPRGCYTDLQQGTFNLANNANANAAANQDRAGICENNAQPPVVKVAAGGCPAGYQPVTAAATCEQAAGLLGLSDTTARVTGRTGRPTGCYYQPNTGTGALFFAAQGTLTAGQGRELICQSANRGQATDVGAVSGGVGVSDAGVVGGAQTGPGGMPPLMPPVGGAPPPGVGTPTAPGVAPIGMMPQPIRPGAPGGVAVSSAHAFRATVGLVIGLFVLAR